MQGEHSEKRLLATWAAAPFPLARAFLARPRCWLFVRKSHCPAIADGRHSDIDISRRLMAMPRYHGQRLSAMIYYRQHARGHAGSFQQINAKPRLRRRSGQGFASPRARLAPGIAAAAAKAARIL